MAKKNLKKGLFITFEGPEGCGKSTHALRVFGELKKEGYGCIFTREPGGTRVGEKIREILLDAGQGKIFPFTELMLFETARSQIVREVIIPALKKKQIVICDRFNDSTVAYQGYAGIIPVRDIIKIDRYITGGLVPDMTILIDVDAAEGLRRVASHRAKDRMERKPISYHNKVRRGYLSIAASDKKRIRVVRSMPDADDTYRAVRAAVMGYVRGAGRGRRAWRGV